MIALSKHLDQGLNYFNISISKEMKEKLLYFSELVLSKNEKMNLTNIVEPESVAYLHFVDSLLPMNYYDFKDKKVVDVGTGAGFPGIPLAIANPTMSVLLLDSQKKRLDFLDEVIKKLDLPHVSTLHMRSEEAGKDGQYREKFDVSISRAVANMSLLIEYMAPLVKVNGYMMALKGKSVEEEIYLAADGFKTLGLETPQVNFISIPFEERTHAIVMAKKSNKTPKKYPRHHGQMLKQPFARITK